MDPEERLAEQEKKLQALEQELNDLRQGLAVVTDFYRELATLSTQQDAAADLDAAIARPQVDDDLEFESIWRFHEDVLVPDASAHVACAEMYDAFVRYCTGTGRDVIGRDAFEFVFAHMENPVPGLDKGEWTGYRLRTDKT
jgi:hypothetical protein